MVPLGEFVVVSVDVIMNHYVIQAVPGPPGRRAQRDAGGRIPSGGDDVCPLLEGHLYRVLARTFTFPSFFLYDVREIFCVCNRKVARGAG